MKRTKSLKERFLPSQAAGLLCLALAVGGRAMAAEPDGVRQVYSHLLDPSEHPDYDRRAVKPPTWATFKNRTQFTCLRGFGAKDGQLVGFAAELEKFTRAHELGDVIWPSYEVLFAKNLGDLADEIKRRDLYLFDIWGYVPGSGPGGYWQQFTPPAGALATLESKLGERWLGTDIGEQDGRYIGGYADQMTPASASRFDQYLNFQRHFERMGDDLGHKHATLVSLNFGHYFLKEGTYTLIGAETAQALPNNQVYYTFIRGAGKQYGVPWFGNASLFNRWGYKTYGSAGGSGGDTHSPTNGTSLSLMKRLLYSHILYNCVAVGFENGWFEGEKLSPIGRIQQAAQRWVKENGQPGVMHTPVALLLDFYSGWTFPRHLYWADVYRVWGNRPYEPGDYLTDAVLDLLYPGYQNSSYFHDESGFITPTPYGDLADCLLSDAPLWVLERYPVVIAAGELRGGRELRDKLQAYAEGGGHLVITAGNLARLSGGLAGRTEAADETVSCGRGQVTFFASPFGVKLQPLPDQPLRSEIDKPLPKPYALEPGVRSRLEQILRSQQLFNLSGEGLSLITCRKQAGEYTIGVANNTWREQPFHLKSLCGQIESLRELLLDQSEKGAVGQTPIGVDAAQLGTSGEGKIAGGDVRIFAVKVKETGVEEIPHVAPPPRPHDCFLTLRRATSIKEEILARPTFFEHFDGVCVDWRSLHDREKAALQKEARWLKRQGVRIIVDLSSGLNLYPTLRLLNNIPADYEASLKVWADVLAKMEILGAKDLVFSLHRSPENNFTGEQENAGYWSTLKNLAAQAAARGVTMHLRVGPGKPPRNFPEAFHYLDPVDAPNLKLAIGTAMLGSKPLDTQLLTRMKGRVGMWLVAAQQTDIGGKVWDNHAPLHSLRDRKAAAQWLATAPAAPKILDALYESQDDEYLDAVTLGQMLPSVAARQGGLEIAIRPNSEAGGLNVRSPFCPGDIFDFRTCEGVVVGSKDFGLFQVKLPATFGDGHKSWRRDGNVWSYSWPYAQGVTVRIEVEPDGDTLKLKYTLENVGTNALDTVQLHTCIPTTEAPGFFPLPTVSNAQTNWSELYDRLHVWSGDRRFTFAETKLAASESHLSLMQRGAVPVKWGWWVNSPETFDPPLIAVTSRDRKKTIALAFERAIWASSNTGDDRACFHLFPWFGRIEPGQSVTVGGRLYVLRGGPQEALKRFKSDFP